MVSIDLFVDRTTGEKLTDELHLEVFRPVSAFVRIPTASGAARDFSIADAELQIFQPRITLNGEPQVTGGPAAVRDLHGSLVWLYFPAHGRFILSLVPRANLGFKKMGEVRSGVLTFTMDGDTVKLECVNSIASGNTAYNLYVLHDSDWEPVSERQKDWPADGTIGADEIAVLTRK
jgi:hypothetical protein